MEYSEKLLMRLDELTYEEQELLACAINELGRANSKHGKMNDPVEGLHTLKCEVAELEREMMRLNKYYPDYCVELNQVAAMGLKLLFHCNNESEFNKLK